MIPIENPFQRKQPWKCRGKAPSGRPYCYSGCGREVPAPRRTSCSRECADRWNAINNPTVLSRKIFERDRGICAHCRLDTEAFRRSCNAGCPVEPPDEFAIADALGHRNQYVETNGSWTCRIRPDVQAAHEVAYYFWSREFEQPWRAFQKERQREAAAMGFTDLGRRWWEADHIVPVIEGGGGCGPEGYRTLCLPCHRRETARLAARLAEKRRKAKQPELTL